ncbi:MAG: hypothetical protein ACTSSE_16640 [Candidatus Thorarchaeota archaeon]
MRLKFWEEEELSLAEREDQAWDEFKPMEAKKEMLFLIIIAPLAIGLYLGLPTLKALSEVGFFTIAGTLKNEIFYGLFWVFTGGFATAFLGLLWESMNKAYIDKVNFIAFPINLYKRNGQRVVTDKRFGDVWQAWPIKRRATAAEVTGR